MNKKMEDAFKIFLAQKHQIRSGEKVLSEIYSGMEDLKELQAKNLDNLSIIEKKLQEDNLDTLLPEDRIETLLSEFGMSLDDFETTISKESTFNIDLTEEERKKIKEELPTFQKLETIEWDENWEAYLSNVEKYLQKYKLNIEKDLLSQLFSPSNIVKVSKKYDIQFGNLKWNKYDYIAIFLSVGIAFLLDYFIVAIPKTSSFLGREYKGSPITQAFLSFKDKIIEASPEDNNIFGWLKKAQTFLEEKAKVPYDFPADRPDVLGTSVEGLSPKTHRLQSFGHDPILGLLIGTLDIMKAQMTVIDRQGKLHIVDRSNSFSPQSLLDAIILQIAHLLSDIFTPQGIPAPFLSILQCLTHKSPLILREGGAKVSYNDLARYMYVHGYTLDHFFTMSIVPLFIDLCLKTYYKIFYFDTIFLSKEDFDLKKDVKLQSMLIFAHTLATMTNLLKMWLYQWNPLTFNIAQLLKTIQGFYAIYKARQERDKKIEEELVKRWQILYNEISETFEKF